MSSEKGMFFPFCKSIRRNMNLRIKSHIRQIFQQFVRSTRDYLPNVLIKYEITSNAKWNTSGYSRSRIFYPLLAFCREKATWNLYRMIYKRRKPCWVSRWTFLSRVSADVRPFAMAAALLTTVNLKHQSRIFVQLDPTLTVLTILRIFAKHPPQFCIGREEFLQNCTPIFAMY